jgi:ABC-type transporter Mla MlaB component
MPFPSVPAWDDLTRRVTIVRSAVERQRTQQAAWRCDLAAMSRACSAARALVCALHARTRQGRMKAVTVELRA